MSIKKAIIGYIISYILSEIFVFLSVLTHCLCDGWHRFVDFAWWQIGMPIIAFIIFMVMTFLGYLIVGKRY